MYFYLTQCDAVECLKKHFEEVDIGTALQRVN